MFVGQGNVTSEDWPEPLMDDPFSKKFFVGLIGGTVVLIGVAMIFLPGPAVVVIPNPLSSLS